MHKDFLGNEIVFGDTIVYPRGKNTRLKSGEVIKLYTVEETVKRFNYIECKYVEKLVCTPKIVVKTKNNTVTLTRLDRVVVVKHEKSPDFSDYLSEYGRFLLKSSGTTT